MKNEKRCVITGLGLITAIGNNLEESWNNALKGVCGIGKVTSVDSEGCYAEIGAEAKCGPLDEVDGNNEMDRVSRLCVKAAKMAIEDGNFTVSEKEAGRVGVVMGSCVGGAVSVENYIKRGEKREDISKMTISPIANHVAAAVGAGGVVTNVANACAAGTISVAYACDLIRSGVADAFVVGGSDAFSNVPFSGFLALHALDENPCSPFNKLIGITLGEGAGALLVESYEHAVKRGAKIYCDVLGSGVTNDAYHITSPRPDGASQMKAIYDALDASGIKEEEVGYVNAHGTGTKKNDEAEFLSLRTVFEGKNDHLNVSSTKSMVGHCLGAAGAVEAVFSVKALTEGKIPPTIGYSEEDLPVLKEREGALDFTPNKAQEKELEVVVSNNFAFGGTDASLVFAKEGKGDVKIKESKEKVYITGLGVMSPAGNGIEEYISAVNGEKAAEGDSVSTAIGGADYAKAGLTPMALRKYDRFSQLQVLSGMAALKDAGIAVTADNEYDIGGIIGTSDGPIATVYSFEEEITKRGNAGGSAFKFPNTVYNAAQGYLFINTGLKGYNVTVTNGAQSGLSALAYAYSVIKECKAKAMLACGTDENSEIMTKLYKALGCVEASPVYSGGDGFVLGDGSTSIALETESFAKERGANVYAEVAGCAMAHKSVKYGTISGSGEALISSIEGALKDAGVSKDEIDAVVGLGNGMKAFDEIERAAYRETFGERELPVLSVRKYTGEGRAASAALSAAHAALILSGKISGEQSAYLLGEEVKAVKTDTSAFKTILVTAAAAGGSYCAAVIKKA